ncbi:response regulator transcription factor [Arthrobacter ulcerisalmonis]|uniref:response regulator transcription factor n=1 Tax=Arthrobacter ulcerisalmonis TaxID=2483813 RepID=UPI001EF01DB6|nr:response regulator transcription factor [Arthrobacter ulcerisalmonis]
METRTVVVVEDDADIREVLATIFREAGFEVYSYRSGLEGVAAVKELHPQVVILDLGLPDIDGFEVARRIRLISNAYLLIVTARTQEADTLLGLDAGADDYITKPFRPRELRHRVEALLRRPRLRSDSVSLTDSPLANSAPVAVTALEPLEPQVFEHNGLRLSLLTRTVEVDGAERNLTATEFALLHALLSGGRVVRAKDELAQILHGGVAVAESFGRDADEQAIQVHVANLRRKLGDSAANPRWVETVHGFGYRMAAQREALAGEV